MAAGALTGRCARSGEVLGESTAAGDVFGVAAVQPVPVDARDGTVVGFTELTGTVVGVTAALSSGGPPSPPETPEEVGMASFAGQLGPFALINASGTAQPAATVTLRNAANSADATAYADRTKTPLANPVPTGVAEGAAGVDVNGVLNLFADPGQYVLRTVVGGTTTNYPVTVTADPAEPADTALATDAEVTSAVSAHAAAADPHPVYLTVAEGNAAYDAAGAAAAAQAAAVQRSNHTGTQSADTLTDGATNKAFLAAERTKLAGVATGATANDTDANLKARANHTGTQDASTITGTLAAARIPDLSGTYLPLNGADPGEGGYWLDDDAGTHIARVRDRLFVGGGADFSGNYAGADDAYLLTARWIPRESAGYFASSQGRIGLAGVSRANLSPVAPAPTLPAATAAIGVTGFCYQDHPTSDATRSVHGWGGYFEAVQANGAESAFGVEIDVGNLGSAAAARTPYAVFGVAGTFGLVVASGGSVGGSYATASFGIAVTNNGAKFKTGLIFENDAIDGTDGTTGTGTAIALARGHVVSWYTPAGTVGANLYSKVDTNANRVTLEFADNVVNFFRADAPIGSIEHGAGGSASVDYVRLISAASGSPAEIRSGGATDVGLDITPAGTGTGRLRGSNNTSKVLWNATGLSFFGTTPIAKATLAAAATDLATAITLANSIRSTLIAYGLTA